VLVFILCFGSSAAAKIFRLGKFGAAYPVIEPNALKEIEDRAAQADWSVLNERHYEKAVKDYRPDVENLPKAKDNRIRQVDMTYVVPADIPDGKGGILFPKGYKYNPLDYVNFTQTLVVINGDDPDQVKWFEQSGYAETFGVMLLLSEGAYSGLAKKLGQPVFYASTDIIRRFQLQAVPSIIRQNGKYMEVREVVIAKSK